MRFVLFLAFIGLLSPLGWAQGDVDKAIVKQVRAALSAKRAEDRNAQLEKIYALGPDAWPSVKAGLKEGPYYQKPLSTAFGERHSGQNFDIRFMGKDNKPRGFSMWVPKSYDAKEALPVLLYLHHAPGHPNVKMGAERAGIGVIRFRKEADKHGFFIVAPYTSSGAEWWVDEGKRLVQWTLIQIRNRYKIDDDRIALLGAMGGGDAVWYLGQEMPGTWSCLMPMSGDPYEITGIIRPLYLGTLDRMDVLAGVPGVTNSTVGKKNALQFLGDLKPLLDKGIRITAGVYPRSQGDFGYLPKIRAQIVSFVMEKKRDPLPKEVDVESDTPSSSLWLRNDGFAEKGDVAPRFPSTWLRWKAPKAPEHRKVLGLDLHKRPKWPMGLVVTKASGPAARAQIVHGDVLLEVDDKPIYETKDVKGLVDAHAWGDEVKLVIAREYKESERPRAEKAERRNRKIRQKIEELRAAGKPIPANIGSLVADEEDEAEDVVDDDDGCGCGEIQISDDTEVAEDKPVAAGKAEKTFFMMIHRWVKLRKPAPVFVRADFGAVLDAKHHGKGVKVGFVYAGSLAQRSGLKPGDIVEQIADVEVKDVYTAGTFFETFKFEDDPEKAPVPFSIKRKEGEEWKERTVSVRWEHPKASRVDVTWNEKEKTAKVLARHLSGFTLYFADELIKPGMDYHVFVNGVPYQDLVDPASRPKYPKISRGTDAAVADQLYRMRRKRAKVTGWTPNIKWAVQNYLKTRDRSLLFGAQRSFDLTKMAAGFEKARRKGGGHEGKRGEEIKRAYDAYKAGS